MSPCNNGLSYFLSEVSFYPNKSEWSVKEAIGVNNIITTDLWKENDLLLEGVPVYMIPVGLTFVVLLLGFISSVKKDDE